MAGCTFGPYEDAIAKDKDGTIDGIANKIALGHAWDKHEDEMPDVPNVGVFIERIEETMKASSLPKQAGDARAWWNKKYGLFVVYNPDHPDCGSAYPSSEKHYIDWSG